MDLHFVGLAGPFGAIALVVFGVFLAVAYVLPFWRICDRMGFSTWLALLILISPLNIILLYYLAFADWPKLRETTRPSP